MPVVAKSDPVNNPTMASEPSVVDPAARGTKPPWHPGRDLTGRLLFLGTGTSVGVPLVGCGCDTCRQGGPRDVRTRTSILVGMPAGHLLVDTTPDLRSQLLREDIGRVDAVLYTHDHIDHVYGLDDVRPLCFHSGRPMRALCEEPVERRIRRAFDYAFSSSPPAGGGVPKLLFERIGTEPFEILGGRVVPLRLTHGPFDVLGFRFGDIAYCTDTSGIPDETWPLLEGLDVLVLDCLRHTTHPTHLSVAEAIAVAKRTGAKRTLLTHISHELPHEATNAVLPSGVELAYDGLELPAG